MERKGGENWCWHNFTHPFSDQTESWKEEKKEGTDEGEEEFLENCFHIHSIIWESLVSSSSSLSLLVGTLEMANFNFFFLFTPPELLICHNLKCWDSDSDWRIFFLKGKGHILVNLFVQEESWLSYFFFFVKGNVEKKDGSDFLRIGIGKWECARINSERVEASVDIWLLESSASHIDMFIFPLFQYVCC